MAMEGELNVLSEAKDVAYELRRVLFHQCTGKDSPPQFEDLGEFFAQWCKKMKENRLRMIGDAPSAFNGKVVSFTVRAEPGSPDI
ncbi:hypothetical protein [Massilia sp. TS11]|uniref:hypothetical protein n=1 Tax=Massilia sp. TS11 TaxID=2908003 RepID=UPI001EDC4D74|nr:hypothetical protein [Massilia sp. TS11]MCG2586832.1 hypothetical protein [Massilia sp. TS11]